MAANKIFMFYPNVSEKACAEIDRLVHARWIGQGPVAKRFEEAIAKRVNAPHAVGVNCASSATRLALSIVGVGPGDEVITTPQTCTATNHPILEQFAVPVFADIQYNTGNIDPSDIEHRITSKTKAIMCISVDGYPSDLDEIHAIGRKHGIPVVEEASDALGAAYKGTCIGNVSDFTVFSFGAVQHVTCGEGGMLCLRKQEDYLAAKRRRWYGIDRDTRVANELGYHDFDITESGYGYHMTDIACAMGLANFEMLDALLERKSVIADRYRKELATVPGIVLFERDPNRRCANQTFTFHVDRRIDFCRMMREKGIDVSIVHVRNDAYQVFGGRRRDLPAVDRFEKTHISIPIHGKLTDEDVTRIITSIKEGW